MPGARPSLAKASAVPHLLSRKPHFPKIKHMSARKSLRPKIAKIFFIQIKGVLEKESLPCGSQD
jgi:hypothetical protein